MNWMERPIGDSKDSSPQGGQQGSASNFSSLSGAACAWNIAFSDLKRRYWISQNEVLLLKNENQKFSTEVHQLKMYVEHLQKENKHLDALLNSKCSSYDKLVLIHNDLVEQDQEKYSYNKDLTRQIVQLNEEKQLFQEQFSKVVVDNQHLRNKCDILQREKKQLENEVEDLKNVPEISISDTNTIVKNREENKQFEELVSENKHLKTSIHWLSDELHKLKMDGQTENVKRVHLSGCLEEGFSNQTLKLNFPKISNDIGFIGYINVLHNTINVLKEQLKQSTKQMKKILDCQVTSVGLTSEEKLMIDANYKESSKFLCNSLEKLESGQILVDRISPNSSSPYEQTLNLCKETSPLNRNPVELHSKDAKNNAFSIGAEQPSLYPSLLQNLQMQQTKIYLKENHVPVKKSLSPMSKEQNGVFPRYDKIMDPPLQSRRIGLYEEDDGM